MAHSSSLTQVLKGSSGVVQASARREIEHSTLDLVLSRNGISLVIIWRSSINKLDVLNYGKYKLTYRKVQLLLVIGAIGVTMTNLLSDVAFLYKLYLTLVYKRGILI